MSDASDKHKTVTKDDLRNAVEKLTTKEDLRRFTTKDDLKRFATKTELKRVEKVLRQEILRVEEKVENVEEGQEDIKVSLVKIQNTLDGFVGTVDNLRTDNVVGAHHTRELQVQVKEHEKRIKRLESSTQAT